MIPIFQTRIHKPEEGIIGNCFRACIASILECDIDDIPKIEEQGMEEWDWEELKNWFVNEKQVVIFSISSTDGNPLMCYPPKIYYIGNGIGPTGVRHSVVFFEGKPVHDPHKGWVGDIEVDDIDFFWVVKK